MGGSLVEARAFLACAVEVVVARKAALLGGLDVGERKRMLVARIGHPERAVSAMQVARAAFVVLGFAEVGQHLVEAPADVALLPPLVEILGTQKVTVYRN